jgi:hypothetical protein
MRVPSRRSRIVYRAALAASLVAVVLSAGAARAGTTEFARVGGDAAIEAESVPTLPDLTALKSAAETEALKWVTSQQLMRAMFKQRAKASKTTPDRLMLYLARQVTPSGAGLNLQFWTLQMIGGQMSNYIGIRTETPDPSYAQITPVAARRILTSDNLDGTDPAFARYATSLSAETTLVQALLKSLQRYQGADADGNGAWALVHARAIRDYASSLASQLDQTVSGMQLMRFVFESDPRSIDAQIAELREWRDRVAADGGFSVAERREAANLGIGPGQLAAMKENLLQDDWNLSRSSVVAHMDELVAMHAALKPILLALATDLAPLIAELEADPLVSDLAPVANAGGPYSGAHSATISFSAGASTSPSAITAYDWDLDGDGEFDDATGVNPTRGFTTTRNTTIGVQVTNTDGQVDVAYARLEVTPASSGGGLILDTFSPFRVGSQFIGEASVRVGETQAFSVTVGNANHYIWYLDDLFTGTSGVPSYSLTPNIFQIGAHSVKGFVTAAGNASLSINWDVAVLAPDGDGDLWNANADCDDTDAAVHPLGNEIAGNGKDDDCDPATSDASPNGPPLATDVSLTTAEDTPVGVTLAGTDADGNPLAGGPTSNPAHGGFVDGVYTPDPDFNGTDSFTFLVVDGHGGSDSGTVRITVTPVDDPPEWEVAPPSNVIIRTNSVATFDVIGRDIDGSDISFGTSTAGCENPAENFGPNFYFDTEFFPSQGVVLDGAAPRRESSRLTIHTKPGAVHGTYCLKLHLISIGSPSVQKVQELSIVVTDGIPVAAPDSYVTDEDVTLTRAAPGVLANDLDPDGGPLQAQILTNPSHGLVTLALNGSFEYVPNPNFAGTDEFTYRVFDSNGNPSEPATASLTVNPVNDPPVVFDQTTECDEDRGVTVVFEATDADGDPVTITTSAPAHGTYSESDIAYHPAANYYGPDSFTYTASDGHGGTATATVHMTVHPVNDAPTVADRSVTTPQDTPVAIALTGTDIEGDPLTFTHIYGPPFHGTYDGTTYTPAPGYSGADVLNYTANDGSLESTFGTISITVTPANPPTDATPPSCEIVEQGKTAAGNAFIRFRVNDVGLGLASHKITYVRNATVSVDTYLPGSLGPVYVQATAVDKRKSLGVQVDFLDRAGNLGICDPIVLSVVREDDQVQDETFYEVPQAESRVSIYNGNPGVRKVVIVVNGKKFKELDLKANEVRKFDVSSAMKPGATNTITVRVRGKKGASALIVIADIP